MNNKDYADCIIAAKSYLFCGRAQFRQITFDDLTTETLIILSENNIPYSIESFKQTLKSARNKMVHELLSNNPNERRKQNERAFKWRIQNPELYKASVLKSYKKCYKPKFGKRGVKKGVGHPKFKGLIITPFGKFESSYEAAKAENTNHMAIQRKCKSEKYPTYFIENNASNDKSK